LVQKKGKMAMTVPRPILTIEPISDPPLTIAALYPEAVQHVKGRSQMQEGKILDIAEIDKCKRFL
jgi:hypothetical protein